MPWSSGDSLSPSILNLRQGEATLATGFSTDTLRGDSGITVNIISDLSAQNVLAGQRIELGGAPSSVSGLLSLRAHSQQSDFIFFQDAAGLKSNFILGERTGDSNNSTVDGLNLFDVSANTMIVRFSADSVRFYPPLVAPVFDTGGALASTYNAALFVPGGSRESKIQAAITAAAADGVKRVYVPASLYPYSAGSVVFDFRVQMVREGGDWGVYDIVAYGADVSGVTAATSAASGMYGALPRGASAFWPAGTYTMHFSSNGSPLVSINTDDISTRFNPGATLRARSLTTLTTTTSEASQYIFSASGVSNLVFEGGVFDGNRSNQTDPAAGFFKGLKGTRGVVVRDMQFKDSSNAYGGIIQGEAFQAGSSATLRDWTIANNKFYRSSWCINMRNLWYGISINNNYFEDCDLDAPASGYSKLGDTAFSRVVRFSGYITGSSTSLSGPIGNVVISGNRFNRCSYAIEVWNQDATNGRNPDYAELIAIQNNAIYSIWGIGVNSFRDVTITGNTWRRLKMSATDITGYPGFSSISSTGGVFGAGIEARPGYDYTVTGNTVDGQWVSGESPDLAGSPEGIELGNNAFNVRCKAVVAGNNISRCFAGAQIQDMQDSLIVGNTFLDNRAGTSGSNGTNTFGARGNVFKGNYCSTHSNLPGTNAFDFYGDWVLSGNVFSGSTISTPTAAIVRLQTTTGRYEILNNEFRYFTGAAIQDSGLSSFYQGNFYSGGTVNSGGAGAVRQVRQNNKTMFATNEHFNRCRAAYVWNSASASSESYYAGVLTFSHVSNFNVADSSSSTFDLTAGVLVSLGSTADLYSPGSAVAPTMAYASEISLGWFRSGVSTMALSYGSLNLNQARLVSVRTTGTSLSSTQLNVSESAFFVGGASGATLGLRVNGIVFLWNSSSTTIG